MQVICIIIACSGLTGVARISMMDFCGKPLIAWSIIQAQQAKSVKGVYVVSDDDEIIKVAEEFGAITIKNTENNVITLEPIIIKAINYIESKNKVKMDLVALLQEHLPLREPEDIDRAVQKLVAENADTLFSSLCLDNFFVWQETKDGLDSLNYNHIRLLKRQHDNRLFVENGSFYLFKPDILRTTNSSLGGRISTYEMDYWKSWKIYPLKKMGHCEWYFKNRLTKQFLKLTPSMIQLIVYDFDGVMTDNRALVLQDGTEAVFVNRSDGWAISMIREMGIKQLIISREANPIVKARAEKLKIPCLHDVDDKLDVLKKYLAENDIHKDNVAFIGNELNDIAAMSYVGFPVAPADAYPEVKNAAKIVLETRGGYGVVREFFDLIKRGSKK